MKIFIPTAGIGQRLANLTVNLNKSLITVGSKPAISHIIDMFPNNSEFVIGYRVSRREGQRLFTKISLSSKNKICKNKNFKDLDLD